MIFKDKNGKLRITFHAPNSKTQEEFEHTVICGIIEKDNTLRIII